MKADPVAKDSRPVSSTGIDPAGSAALHVAMRIIAGEFKSRRLISPPDDGTTRPMPDRVRESVFAILRGHVEDAIVFDIFCGTGSIGLEALSRGASQVFFADQSRECIRALKQNLETLGIAERAVIYQGDALGPVCLARSPQSVHLAFFDPPYAMITKEHFGRVAQQMQAVAQRLDADGFLVLRTPCDLPEGVSLTIEGLIGPETHEYNTTAVHLYQRQT